MSNKSKNTKNGSANRYVLLAVIVVAAIVLDLVAITGNKSGSTAGSNKVEVGQTQNITWNANSIPRDAVTVNLIKKVSDNPNAYELVRTIAMRTANDGSATWVPAKTDVGTGLSLEIGCTHGNGGCVAIDDFSSKLAVVDGGMYSDTASAYSAIEAASNK